MKNETHSHVCLPYELSNGITPIITPEISIIPKNECLVNSEGGASGIILKPEDNIDFEKIPVFLASEIPQILEELTKIKALVHKQISTPKGGWTEKQLPHVGKIMETPLMKKIAHKDFQEIKDATENFQMVNDFLSQENEKEIDSWMKVLKEATT